MERKNITEVGKPAKTHKKRFTKGSKVRALRRRTNLTKHDKINNVRRQESHKE
uniref:Uncharacterized protein n=1 Tax=Dulem virus 37 TaxID=3145755 RepID=A0AAU8AY82_9CAUD